MDVLAFIPYQYDASLAFSQGGLSSLAQGNALHEAGRMVTPYCKARPHLTALKEVSAMKIPWTDQLDVCSTSSR